MKHIFILSIVLSFSVSVPSFSQSFLEKALKKVDKAAENAESFLKSKKESDSSKKKADGVTETEQSKQTPVQSKQYVTSWKKNNIKGQVKTITEVQLWDGVESKSTYTYNPDGMIEEYTCEDGVVGCAYSKINGIPFLASLSVKLSTREYASIEWDGRQYMSHDVRTFYNDDQGRLSLERGIEETVKYTYLNGGKVVRADIERTGAEVVPSLYVYDKSGNLTAEYFEKIEGEPVRLIRYDDKNRKVYEKGGGGLINEYKYNDNNDVIYRKTTGTYGEDEDSEYSFTYRYDTKGNWVEKNWKSSDGQTICVYKRTIEYY